MGTNQHPLHAYSLAPSNIAHHLDKIKLPVPISSFDLDGLLPGHRSFDGLHAVAVSCHDIRMHNRGGQSCLGHSPLAVALAEDRGLNKGPITRPS